MSRYISPAINLYDEEIADAASRGLNHYSECQTEGVLHDREFFPTREEARNSAAKKSGYDEICECEFEYEVRSMWRDEDDDIVVAEDETEQA